MTEMYEKGRNAHQLLTFAPMIDSELARLLLHHYQVSFREADHLFGWVSLLTLFHGGYGQVPLFHGSKLNLSGPLAIARHFDPALSRQERLLPCEQPLRTAVETDCQRFNGGLAADVAAVCYFHMLPERRVMSALFARSIPRGEARSLRWAYPLLRKVFSILLRLNKPRIDDAVLRIQSQFEVVGRRVADNRRFITGDRLTLADFALASAAAPLLLPKAYTAPVPGFDDMPPALRKLVEQLRSHPAAAFIEKLYEGFKSSSDMP